MPLDADNQRVTWICLAEKTFVSLCMQVSWPCSAFRLGYILKTEWLHLLSLLPLLSVLLASVWDLTSDMRGLTLQTETWLVPCQQGGLQAEILGW